MKRLSFLVGFLLLLSLPLLSQSINIAVNPGFEEADSGNPSMPAWWTTDLWNTSGGVPIYAWDDKVAHAGKRSILITCPTGSIGAVVKYGVPSLNPDKFYQMSAWVKTENAGGNSGIILDGCEVMGERPWASIDGTHDWKKLTIKGAMLKAGVTSVDICLVCRGGKLWFDDVEVVAMDELGEGGEETPTTTIPASSSPSVQTAGQNLLENPSFEEITSEPRYPVANWNPHEWTGEDIPTYKYKQDESVFHSGKASMYSECSQGTKGAWSQRGKNADPSKTYQASVWLKGENLAAYSGLIVDSGKVDGNRPCVPASGTFDWQKVTIKSIKPDANELIFTILNRGGKLWADDAELREE